MKRNAPRPFHLHRETLATLTARELAAQHAGRYPVQPLPLTRHDPICGQPSYNGLCV